MGKNGKLDAYGGLTKENTGDPRALEKRLLTIIEESPLGVHVFTPEGKSLLTNRAWDKLWDLEKDLQPGNIFDDEQVRDAGLVPYIEKCLGNGVVETPPLLFDPERTGGRGEKLWLRAVIYPVADATGNVREITLLLEDVTERKNAGEALRESEARLKAVTSGAPVVLFAVDAEGRVTFAEGRGLDALSGDADGFVGGPVHELFRHDPECVRRAISGERLTTEGVRGGATFEVRYSPMDNGHAGAVGVAIDVTERRELEARLHHQALHDGLTGLANRTLFLDRLEHALLRAEARGGRVAVLYLDLDNFKYVNDSLGHGAGDGLLVEMARRFRESVRAEDTVARFGGDEFVVLLEAVGDSTEETAARISREARKPLYVDGREVFATVSAGVAIGAPEKGDGAGALAEKLLRNADVAMYHAKLSGKDRIAVFQPSMVRESRERLSLESDLRRAGREEFEVHYQPRVSVATERIVGFEALARWRHPERGLVPPGDFIPLAEETGLIETLGVWVLDEACARLKGWRSRYRRPSPLSVNVNVSARQLRDPDFAAKVESCLKRHGLEAGSLTLEITESTAMENAPSAPEALRRLGELGVGIAIDDFGTGYSSLGYLRHLPADVIKVDRSIVSGLDRNGENHAIFLSVVTLARSLGLFVVAEGVETEAEREKVRALGCDEGQGFFWHRPLPADKVSEILDAPEA